MYNLRPARMSGFCHQGAIMAMNGISSTASRSSLQSLPDAPQPQPTGADSPQPASSPSTPGNSQTLTRMARDARPPLAGQQQAAAANAKGAATGTSQLNIDDKGHVQHERVLLKTTAGRELLIATNRASAPFRHIKILTC